VFEYRQAQEICEAFQRRDVRFLFIGKAGAVLLGFPDTTQDADVFVEKSRESGLGVNSALVDLGFDLTEDLKRDMAQDLAPVQLKNGPFDLDLIFAPDGIERFEDAWRRHVDVSGFPVCHIDDIIASKQATGRERDRESLPRLREFRKYWKEKNP
jgi:hypothetical protein